MFSLDRRLAPPKRLAAPWPVRVAAASMRRFAVLVAILAIAQRSLLRRGLRWKLTGECKSCGRCCENLLLDVGDDDDSAVVRGLRRFWHETVFDFYPKVNVLDQNGGRYRAYGCRNFTAERTCSRYALRPFVCRAYPALALKERPHPKAHCGFKVIDD